ncbi:hypothetical protein IX296_000987 [Bacteroides pyogenes]|nr:hypothetical protein [Bacteroides pyogenes]MBR8753914.1 hypothetical protein [Bacteroides pyogenes]MBR8808708.1 hypothetical protein [Bacteroides pyogenes]
MIKKFLTRLKIRKRQSFFIRLYLKTLKYSGERPETALDTACDVYYVYFGKIPTSVLEKLRKERDYPE